MNAHEVPQPSPSRMTPFAGHPIVVGIVVFHSVLAPAGVGLALVVLGLQLYLAWSYRDAFAPMLHAHTETARSVGLGRAAVPAA